jgi:uncharacterized membrane protein
MKNKTVFYAGDSPAGGPANYLLSILKSLKLDVTHIPPGKKIPKPVLKKTFDLYIFSDYGYIDLDAVAEKRICDAVNFEGASLGMIGGWGSFSGNFGGWRKSDLAKLLPVQLSSSDDRLNYASGLYLKTCQQHKILKSLKWNPSPVICGLNRVKAKKEAKVLVEAFPLIHKETSVALSKKGYPLLVVDEVKDSRRAALSCDLAPHWAGGWVDWGTKRCLMPVNDSIKVEIGDQYVLFVQNLIQWLLKSE